MRRCENRVFDLVPREGAARRRHEEPKQDPGDTRLEIVWTVIPAGILLYLLILTAQTMHTVNPPPEALTHFLELHR